MEEQLFKFCGFDETTRNLLRTYCQATISSQELGAWFATVEFDALPPHITCMAAAAGSSVRFADVPGALIPRLRGIVKYVHTLNSGMFSGVCLLGTACNQAGIQALLLEDTALYMRYPDEPQRHLWQVSIGIPAAQYEKVLALAENSGFSVERHPYAAVARNGVTQQIVIRPLEEDSYLWDDAAELQKGNATFLCPSAATMLIEACQKAFRVSTKANPQISLVRWCMDTKILLQHFTDEDWTRCRKIAEKENAKSHIRYLMAVYERVTAQEIKEAEFFGTKKEADKTFQLLKAYTSTPETGHKLRRVYLLYRLRRPDSAVAATALLIRRVIKKIKGYFC